MRIATPEDRGRAPDPELTRRVPGCSRDANRPDLNRVRCGTTSLAGRQSTEGRELDRDSQVSPDGERNRRIAVEEAAAGRWTKHVDRPLIGRVGRDAEIAEPLKVRR